jgi:hypothetical protein
MTFASSQASLDERRRLLMEFRLVALLALALACLEAAALPATARLALWGACALLALGLARLDTERYLAPLRRRELRLQGQALELVRGDFTRLLFFSQLEQLRMIQGRDEKVLALQLRTMDGSVLLRGYENMEALFSALMARKPERVLLEVEESRMDWHSMLLWSRIAYAAGLLVMGILVFR